MAGTGKHRRPRTQHHRMAARAAGTAGVLAVALGAGVAPAGAAGRPGPAHGGEGNNAPAAAPDTLSASAVAADSAPAGAAVPRPVRVHRAARIPAPTGHYQVGVVNLHLRDTSRTDPYLSGHHVRELMVSLWYPSTGGDRQSGAPWLQSLAAAHYLAGKGVSDAAASLPITAGHTGAPVDAKAGKLPVLLYSTGLHSDRAMGTDLVEDLASHGYLVVAIDHTHDANEVQFPGDRLAVDTMPAGTHASANLAVRAADTSFVIDQLIQLAHGHNPDVDHAQLPSGLGGAIDTSRIGMFGWSLGGAATGTAMYEDHRIAAGADLDGTFYGPVAGKGVGDRPFLLFSAQNHNRNTDSSWSSFWSQLHGPRYDLRLQGAQHLSFSDNETLLPQEAGLLGLTASQLRDSLGTIDPDRAVAIERAYLVAFFDRELRHQHNALLDGPSKAYPEISFVR